MVKRTKIKRTIWGDLGPAGSVRVWMCQYNLERRRVGERRERTNFGFKDLKSILRREDGAVLIHVLPSEKQESWCHPKPM